MDTETITIITQLVTGSILTILYVVGFWKIFKKAGVAGWKSIIPVYNMHTFFKISWKTSAFWLWMAGLFVSGVLSVVFPENLIVSIIAVVIALIAGIIYAIAQCKMGFAFGKGFIFAIGLILFNPLFITILGLGSAQYQGSHNS